MIKMDVNDGLKMTRRIDEEWMNKIKSIMEGRKVIIEENKGEQWL